MSKPPDCPTARRDFLMTASLALGAGMSLVPSLSQPSAAQDGELKDEIAAVLTRTEEIWNSQNFSQLKEVWDADDPEPWYVPEEIETPFRSWPEIERYWNPGRKVLEAFRWQFSNLHVKRLSDDLTLALFDHFYEIEIIFGDPEPTAGFDRVITLFRKKTDGWKHILYAQCPLGPDTYIRALRQRIVRPDFEEFKEDLSNRE